MGSKSIFGNRRRLLAPSPNDLIQRHIRPLEELAAKNVYEFAFIMQRLKVQGGTGSTVSPVAVR